jgi:hypothetical protein
VEVHLERDFLAGTNPEVQASGQEVKEYNFDETSSFNHDWIQGEDPNFGN